MDIIMGSIRSIIKNKVQGSRFNVQGWKGMGLRAEGMEHGAWGIANEATSAMREEAVRDELGSGER